MCKVSLSSRESRLVQAILFKTFGYHKSSDWICYEQLSELTGIDRSNIGKVKASLIQRRILLRDGKKIGINPVTSQWVMNIRNGSIRSAQREIQSLNGTSEEEKRVKTDSCQSQKRLKKTPSDSAQKESELTFEKVEIDSQKSQFRPPQKKNTLQKTNIKDLSTNSLAGRNPNCLKRSLMPIRLIEKEDPMPMFGRFGKPKG
ncbi:replication protein [Vibrio penaeicida]|uniref:replication protein n=1 Tax=Vibrio penaeicida TaxID=104609 RepID=UPI001CC497A9